MKLSEIHDELMQLANKEIAAHSQRFFKTGKGQYGEGDVFLGIRVPVLRKLIKKYRGISLAEIEKLLKSKFHEERLLAVLMLVNIFQTCSKEDKKAVFDMYLKNTLFINNWDLVDISAANIVGSYLHDKDKAVLYELVGSENLWERRISIISTFYFIKQNEFEHTLKIAEMLLGDNEELIHKAVGWMLREVGKRRIEAEEKFLKEHYKDIPRIMLRYAIERFPEKRRKMYLRGKV